MDDATGRITARLAARVSSLEQFFGLELLDHDETLRLHDDSLQGTVLVAGCQGKLSRFGAHGFVLLRRQADVLDAVRLRALAQELEVVSGLLAWVGEAGIRFPDPLVDLPEEGFVRR
jgi:hypothetical protein